MHALRTADDRFAGLPGYDTLELHARALVDFSLA